GRRLPQRVGAVDLRARARDLALIAVEDAQGDAHADAVCTGASDAFVGDAGRDVAPGVGARQLAVGAGARPRGLRRPQVGARVQRAAAERDGVERYVTEAELAAQREVRRHRLRPHRRAERDACGRNGLARVGGVTLEREALNLDARQLELGDVALFSADALQAFDLVDRAEVFAGERQRRLRHEGVGERLLDLSHGLAAYVS